MSLSFRDLVFGNRDRQPDQPEKTLSPVKQQPRDENDHPLDSDLKPGTDNRKRKARTKPSTKTKREKRSQSRGSAVDSDSDASGSIASQSSKDESDSEDTPSMPSAISLERVEKIALRRLKALYPGSKSSSWQTPRSPQSSPRHPPLTPPSPSLSAVLPTSSPSGNNTGNATKLHPMVLENPHIPASQLPRYPSPRVLPRRRRRKRDEETDTESEADEATLQQRQAEQARKEELAQERQTKKLWHDVRRRRWKARRVDLRSEMMEPAVLAAVTLQQKKKVSVAPSNESDSKISSGERLEVDDEDENSEDEDVHGEVMKRLMRPSAAPKTNIDGESQPLLATSDPKVSTPENFWTMGHMAPRVDPSLYAPQYLPKISRRTRPSARCPREYNPQNDTCDQDKYPGLRTWANPKQRDLNPPGDCESLFPSAAWFETTVTVNPRRQHQLQMIRLAARYLTCAAYPLRDLKMCNQLLRYLWDPALSKVSSHSLVERHALQCGASLLLILSPLLLPRKSLHGTDLVSELGIVCDYNRLGLPFVVTKLRNYAKKSRLAEEFLEPSSRYSLVTNTEPPVPQLPLNIIGVEFGPTDRFNFMWRKQRVPEEAIKISLSTLFSRWVACKYSQDSKKAVVEHQMYTMLEHTTRLNDNKVRRLLNRRKNPIDELPAVEMYKSIITFCNLIASNGGKAFWKDGSIELTSEMESRLGWSAAARQIFEFLDPLVTHPSLQSFPRIHLIHAILRICMALPMEAADILSAFMDQGPLETPFTVVRHLLEFLESQNLLVENKTPGTEEIEAGTLEYLFFLASESILKCIDADPTEPHHHAWYIAFKAGSLLLCSGNRIGSGARLFPSTLEKKMTNELLFEMMEDSPTAVKGCEARPMLFKFEEVRVETIQAFQLLLKLTEAQQTSRSYLALASFLEWREVVALIIGDSSRKQSYFAAVRAMHKQCSRKWASLDRSPLALEYLKRCEGSERTLSLLADEIETCPENVDAWRCLVRALGAWRTEQSQTKDSMHPDEALSHSAASVSASGETILGESVSSAGKHPCVEFIPNWARGRISWWSDQLLHIFVPKTIRSKHGSSIPAKLRGDLDKLRNILQDWLKVNSTPQKPGGFPDSPIEEDQIRQDAMGWIEACRRRRTLNLSSLSPLDRHKMYDCVLPKSIQSILETPEEVDYQHLGSPFTSLQDVSARVQVTCYRLLIRHHIYGAADPLFVPTVQYFLCTLWNFQDCTLNTTHEHACALKFLSSMGLDLLAALPIRSPITAKEWVTWPPEMRRVVAAHVAENGPQKWHQLHASHPDIFGHLHKHKARMCYKFLERQGLL